MRFITVTSVACLVASAAAFEYPDFVPLNKRQEPGTPQYECHANCGGIITASRSDGYCDSSDFKSMFNDCMNCALEYDIWKYYGNSVSSAAENCGLDATPVQPSSSSASTATSTSTATETETEAESTSTVTESDTETETISSTETSTDSTTVSSTPVIPTVTTTTTPTSSEGAASGTPTPSNPEFTGGASSNAPAGLFMGGLVGSFVAALMV
ncbi:uncharacterized protein DSM5745_06081 [Aspergillus mulundensis]|uniref:Uncharacterized protein n=1 Tax=Aspergillus mulundensis TaxID=1810919 RepID=A0A3D8RYV1_9EURO|nr:Uncharacterized protein DSM5745_06081 [Aspergillus mulundensis]RDW79229.1 Uncharacterized protein DSM5745_06081 [Aspergillus mulundensis]